MTIFTEPWFLDAVAPGQWIEIRANDGEASARFVAIERKLPFGRVSLGHGPLLPRLGPEYHGFDHRSTPARLSQEHQLLGAIIEQLPKHDDFIVAFHWTSTNAMAFEWAGFDLRVVYTYLLQDLSDLDAVWEGFTTRARTAVRKAERSVVVTEGEPFELYRQLGLTFAAQDRSVRYPFATLERAVAALEAHGQGQILAARDDSGTIHAAQLVAWDSTCGYYLVAGSDPALRSSGAMSLLMWEAIKLTAKHAPKFDFEGSRHRGIEQFIRSFGGEQIPYVQVTRSSWIGRALRALGQLRRLPGATARVRQERG